jgi:Na+-transporting NADH:ubiquinone oxidoreductase subunit C
MQQVKFMVIVSVVFIAALATVNELTRARIEKNFEIELSKERLYAFDIFPDNFQASSLSLTSTTASIPWEETQILDVMQNQMKEVSIPVNEAISGIIAGSFLEGQQEITIFTHVDTQGDIIAYGLPLVGKGLWGTIEGFGVISADLQKMKGVAFTKQVETPGLGARITEEEYKSYFRNLDLNGFHGETSDPTPVIMVKQKATSNIEDSTNSVQAITGATQTSQGVLDMINSNLAIYIKIIQEYQAQSGA